MAASGSAEVQVNAGLEAKVDKLSVQNSQLQNQVSDLERKVSLLEAGNSDLKKEVNYVFDCFLTEPWDTVGVITFNDCTFDSTGADPMSGSFVIPQAGVWRFTFTAGDVVNGED